MKIWKRIAWVLVLMAPLALHAQKLRYAEYFFDSDPGFGKATSIPMVTADSILLTPSVQVPADMVPGLHVLFARVQDEAGVWGMTDAVLLQVGDNKKAIGAAEYFFDNDPGYGKGTPIVINPAADSISITPNIVIPALASGQHVLYVRVRNERGVWGFTESYPIKICGTVGPTANFGYRQDGNQIFFSDSSVNSTGNTWYFGDGTIDTTGNPKYAYPRGSEYNVKLVAHNACGDDSVTKLVRVLGVYDVQPSIAPVKGLYVGYVKGDGFTPNTQLLFRKNYTGEILNPDTVIYVNPGLLKVLMRITNGKKDPVPYSAVVFEPSTQDNHTMDNALTVIDSSSAPPTWVRLEGRMQMIPNRWFSYDVVVGNNSNRAVFGVPVYISLPGTIKARLIDGAIDVVGLPQHLKDSIQYHFYTYYDSTKHDSVTYAMLLLEYLEAGQVARIRVEFRNPELKEFSVKLSTGNPWFPDSYVPYRNATIGGVKVPGMVATMALKPVQPSLTDFCKPTPCLKCLIDAAGYIPGVVGCVTSIYGLICNIYNDMGKQDDGTRHASAGVGIMDVSQGYLGVAIDCFAKPVDEAIGIIHKLGEALDGIFDKKSLLGDCKDCMSALADTMPIHMFRSLDPNVMTGPTGYGVANYTDWQAPYTYSVQFENLASATAPASEIWVTNRLDTTRFDMSTLRFNGFSFGDSSFNVIEDGKGFVRDIDLRPSKNAILRVSASLDSLNKIVVHYMTLDPGTMRLTQDIQSGFLDPNVDGRKGLGNISYRVGIRSSLGTGTIIQNQASIVFDGNTPLPTNVVINGVDKQRPDSKVEPISQRLTDTTFRVRWTGNDAHAGIRHYRLFVSVNDSAYQEVVRTTADSADIVMRPGSKYNLYTIAMDNVGNVEDAPSIPDQTLTPSVVTGINDPTLVPNTLKVYPNPFRESLAIRYKLERRSLVQISLVTMDGKTIELMTPTYQVLGTHQLDLSTSSLRLGSGNYFLLLRADGKLTVRKLVKME